MRAPFITFEGPEGGGKTTQVALLERALLDRDIRCQVTREPGGTELANSLRKVLLSVATHGMGAKAELLLMLAARADHVQRLIRPGLDEGTTVICDRFVDSTVAYQGAGRGLDMGLIGKLNHFATSGLVPDLTLLLDVPVEVGLKRAARTSRPDRFEGQALDFHQRLREAFRQLAEREPERIKILDARQPEEETARQVLEQVDKLLRERG